MSPILKSVTLAGLLTLCGCTTLPTGPSIMALPGADKTFDQFRADDSECRQYAQYQIGGKDANQAATDAGLRSAAAGTVIGTLAGAAIGGHEGAGVGAGTGLLMGSMVGAGAANQSAYGTQRQYDNAYVQCMYAKGEQVPVSRPLRTRGSHDAPRQGVNLPPPPANYPPPNYPPPQ